MPLLLVRSDNAEAVIGALRAGRRIARAQVSRPATGWTAVRTDDAGAAAAALDLSRRLDNAVFASGVGGDPAAFEVCCRGRKLFCAGAGGDVGDTDMLAPFLVAEARLADLKRQALTGAVVWWALGLPEVEAAPPPGERAAAVAAGGGAVDIQVDKKRWWEFWV
jgi:hypothetical protein